MLPSLHLFALQAWLGWLIAIEAQRAHLLQWHIDFLMRLTLPTMRPPRDNVVPFRRPVRQAIIELR
jgi:hypothetical protein